MNADSREFVDTNVLVYAFDVSAGGKKRAAERLLERLWHSGTGCLSVQVLQEFFVTVTSKVGSRLSAEDAAERVRDFTSWTIFAPTAGDVLGAITLHSEHKISFWDGMVLQAAAELGCHLLWSEDLNEGQRIRGVRIRNPFTPESTLRGE
jgi:predicted nucleic acid-binding protein